MKTLLIILFSSSLSVFAFAQQGGVPPVVGTKAPPVTAPDDAAASEPQDIENPSPSQNESETTSIISGAALPANGSMAFHPGSSPTEEPSTSPSAAPGASGAPGATPPGLPGAGAPGEPVQVDFLQRSNLILAKLLDSERTVDPFGLVMDPANAKEAPILADQYEEEKEATVVNNSMLKNALLTLPITGVYPQRGSIVIGARSFDVGGQFGMKLQDLVIRLRFEGVRGGEIFFKDMETREVTSVPYNTRPAEFEPMAKGSKRAPGAGISPMDDLYIAN